MSKKQDPFASITKSKFLRSVFLQVAGVFLVVVIAIIVVVFLSFTSEINKNIITDRQDQLCAIEDTFSARMNEAASIAYNIGNDTSFTTEPLVGDKYSGYAMCNMLSRYLVGNSFIKHLAYYRTSEPDKIYSSVGEMSFSDFWSAYLGFEGESAGDYLKDLTDVSGTRAVPVTAGLGGRAYMSYITPLPIFSDNPQAYVLMYIPLSEIEPLFESQLSNYYGETMVYDSAGTELYRLSTLEQDVPFEFSDLDTLKDGGKISFDGSKYVVQTAVSPGNSWTYVSIIRLSDLISGLATKQIVFIVLLFAITIIAIGAMLVGIIALYKPINKLAAGFTDDSGRVIDERSLLSNTFATLKDDSEQKQMFETAYHEADAANKAKSIFLSNMSHDIRTPMNAIIGMTEFAMKNPEDPDNVRACLQKVQIASEYLLDIINNVLDMSRIESGRFTLAEESVELPKLVYSIMTILRQNIEDKHQTLIVEAENIDNEAIIGDNVRITQIFMNILSNSVKFTPEGGTISLHMSQQESDAEGFGSYTFVFKDTGIGMSPEFVNQVFDTFSRDKKSGASKIEGTGLGMAIAKNLVDLMGGTISCESELGVGTTFTVTLPLKLADSGYSDCESKYSDMTALILGGDEKLRQTQTALFESFGVKATGCEAITEAERLVKSAFETAKAYSFVVINPPDNDRNGIKTVKKLRAAADSPDTKYVLTAHDFIGIDQSSAFNSGIAAFIHLPMFKSTVANILSGTYEARNAANKPAETVPEMTGKRVLVVEDNLMNREIACRIIKETGAEIVEAANGQEAFDLFESHDAGYYDVILMDIQMPLLNGYEATAAIRSLPRPDAQTIPIFALTANTFDEDVRQVKESGMNGHISKPYMPAELFKILDRAMELGK